MKNQAIYVGDEDRTNAREGVLIAMAVAGYLAEKATEKTKIFLSTHPLPIGVANTVNGFLGHGVGIQAVPSKSQR